MKKTDQQLVEEMQKIADRPVDLESRFQTMNDLYDSVSYHPPVTSAPPDTEMED